MKKILSILAILAVLPVFMFAEKTGGLDIGGAMFFKSPVLLGQLVDRDSLNVNQFVFGGDVRYKLGWFQAEGLLGMQVLFWM
ncbi:MAG: hypothetical protein WCR31_10135 [Treponema sp.]